VFEQSKSLLLILFYQVKLSFSPKTPCRSIAVGEDG